MAMRAAKNARGWSSEHVSARDRSGPVDPYLLWARATGFADLTDQVPARFPVVLEITKSAREFADFVAKKRLEWIKVPVVYRRPPAQLAQTRFCTAQVAERFFAELHAGRILSAWVKRFELGLPLAARTRTADASHPSSSPARITARRSSASSKPHPVIVGVIDEGIAFAHALFREPGGATTRVEHFWNQDEPIVGASIGADAPADLGYGLELSKASIDHLLQDCTHAGCVEEEELYRRAGNRQVANSVAHGTHVMSLACGRHPADAVDAPRIICVQLARRAQLDTSRCSLAVHVLDALRFILARAAAIAAVSKADGIPVVVNFSYAPFAGPHEGSSILEQAIDELIDCWGVDKDERLLSVVLPSGNGLLSRCHARLALGAYQAQTLRWRVQADDATPSFMQIWLPPFEEGKPAQEVEIEVQPPGGEGSPRVVHGQVCTLRSDAGVVCTIVHADRVELNRRRSILVAIAPTVAAFGESKPVAPAGVWKVGIRNAGGAPLNGIDAWIQRDDSPYGNAARGRQSYFDDPNYVRRDAVGRDELEDSLASYVKRDGTISAIATGRLTAVIGGLRRREISDRSKPLTPAPYSARGTAELAASGRRIQKPKALELKISEDSMVLPGKIGAGVRSGSIAAVNGTSVAAPQKTRQIADKWLQSLGGGSGSRQPSPATTRRPVVER